MAEILDKINLRSSFLIGLGLVNAGVMYSQKAGNEKPNVVLIYADDIGYGDIGCYGASKVRTPNIDKLSQQGKMFLDAHVASAVSTPSRYCLLTGQYAFREEVFGPVFDQVGALIDPDRLTVADVMKEAGYSTACIGKWHLGFGDEKPDWNGKLAPGPLEVGFDYFFGVPTVSSHPPFVYVENHGIYGYEPSDPIVYGVPAETRAYPEKMNIDRMGGAKKAHALYQDEMVGTTLTEKAVSWIKEKKDGPFFLYFPTTNIHHPFTPHPRFNGTSDAGRYGDFIHELDWIVGAIMNTLEEEGLEENTILIFTSDNGGMFNQGGQDAWTAGHRLNGDLLGFKFDAWEGGHRVPFIVRWPGKIKAGSKSSVLISNVDMVATFAALTGYDLKYDEGPDSYNVLPAFLSNSKKQIRDHLVISPLRKPNMSVRKGDWMYIDARGGGGFNATKPGDHGLGGPPALKFAGQENSDIEDGKIKKDAPMAQLYNLKNDFRQKTNVINENKEVADELKALLEKIRSEKMSRPVK